MINSCFDTFGDLRSEEENIFLTSTRGKYQSVQLRGGGVNGIPPTPFGSKSINLAL